MATKIMIVRHGEKPDKRDGIFGVTTRGRSNKDDLSIRGWQRAGALVRFFNPVRGDFADARLARPDRVVAAAPSAGSRSRRSIHTVESVARSIGKRVGSRRSKGEEDKLVADLMSAKGVVLVAWEHHAIVDIANRILGSRSRSPQTWSDVRFDLVWIFDRQPKQGGWSFSQVPQLLLPGDSRRTL
jgi:broad specificity phosphatase PhoE